MAVSRLSEQKGLDLLLRAFARVRAVVPNVWLVVVGEGPARVAVEADVKRLGLSDAVAFLGYVAHRELPALGRSGQLGEGGGKRSAGVATSDGRGAPRAAPTDFALVGAASSGLCIG